MSRDSHGGDASGSPGRSYRIAAAGDMQAARDDFATATPGSIPQTYQEKAMMHEIGGSSSTAEAVIDETTDPMTSMPRADSVLLRHSGLGRETWRSLEIAGSSSTAAIEEAAAPRTSMPGADSLLLRHSRYSGLGRGFQLGTVPIEMLNGAGAVSDGRIFDIWSDDVARVFDEIRTEMRSKENRWCLVGMDTEFCRLDGIEDPRVPPKFAEDHYQQTKRIVDEGNLVQIGIAIGDTEGSCRAVYQFNLQFNPSSRDSMSPNIAFLTNVAKLDLDQHRSRGIDPSIFFLHLHDSGLLKNNNISWITYQGYADFGYLIRGLENIAALPLDRSQFLHLVRKYFPRSIDLKIFHMKGICCNPPVRGIRGSGSFQSMACSLRVKRLGEAHGAGSDAHLTLLCYHAMVISNPIAAYQLCQYRNTVYGVDEAIPRTPQDTEISYVEVYASNWNSESKLITDTFESNTCTAAILSVNHELTSSEPISYHAARVLIEGLTGPLKLGFALSDQFGRIAFGRIWILNLQGTSRDPSHIRHDQLATVLTQANALFNHGITWCSSSSFAHTYMLKALTTARCLPTSLQGSCQLHYAFFPSSLLVRFRSTEKREGHRSLETLRSLMKNPALAFPTFSGFLRS